MSEEEEENVSRSSDDDSLITRLLQCRFWCCKRRNRLQGFEDMEILAELGAGVSGKVFRCRDRNTHGIVAVKEIEFPVDQRENLAVSIKIANESSVLRKLDHNNIVRLLKTVVTKDRKRTYLVFENLDCDLHQYIRDHHYTLDSMIIKNFLHQILLAVAYCHSKHILHRDLKPMNLLIDVSMNIVKLADFGAAVGFEDPDINLENFGLIGTPWYMAPETLFGCPYSTPVDLWSVGCIFGEMVIGNPIFHTIHQTQSPDELDAIFRVLGTPTEETWPGVTGFDVYPNYRQYDARDLSRIFNDLNPDGINLLTRMLTLNPNNRISAEAALEHAYFNDLV